MVNRLRLIGNSRLLAATVIAGTLLAVAAVVAAAGSGGTTTFNGCQNVQTGVLRMLPNKLPPPFNACITAGNPILQNQPDLLEIPVSWNSVPPQEPQTVNVDCAAGQTITAALQAAPVHLPLTLNVHGTCTESVQVQRDDVTFNAVNAGDGISSPNASQTALFLNGARHIMLFGFTLTGGNNALSATGGAGVFAMNLHVTGAGNGILLTNASSGQFFNLTADHCSQSGAGASSGSALNIGGGSITDSGNGIDLQNGHLEANNVTIARSANMGVAVRDGGTAELQNTTVQYSGNTGVHVFNGSAANLLSGTVVSGSTFGGVVAHSGSVNLQGAHVTGNHGAGVSTFAGGRLIAQGGTLIDANDGDGVMVAGGGVASLQGPNTITNNAQFGVHLRDIAMLQLGPGTNATSGNGSAPDIFCEASALARVSGQLGTSSTNCQTS